jgi:hypothetical protein
MAEFELEKRIWTEQDFERMGWHDAKVYGLRLHNDLELDIDYILQWNSPDPEGFNFTFWVAPATLVFKNIENLKFEVGDLASWPEIEIEDIGRTREGHKSHWIIVTNQGEYEFDSDGYEQFIRQEPSLEYGPNISLVDRHGFSLERTTNQEIPSRLRGEIIERRKKDAEHYENAKKRHLKRREKEQLDKARNNDEIDLKQYQLMKREIKEMLDHYDDSLKGTRFESW